MPSIVGNIKINSNIGIVNFGDTTAITTKIVVKIISGPIGGIGNIVNTLNGATINNVQN